MTDRIRLHDVRLEIDRSRGRGDGSEHGGEIGVAVLQQFDFVPLERDGISEPESGGKELRRANREGVLEVILEGVAADEEETEDEDDTSEGEDETNPSAQMQPGVSLVQRFLRTRTALGHPVRVGCFR